jgi:transmembrane sensor
MSITDPSLLQLLEKYTTYSITEVEKQQLYDLLRSPEHLAELETIIDNQLQSSVYELPEDNELRQVIFHKIQQKILEPAKVKKLSMWKRLAVAASILFLIGVGSYFVLFNKEVSAPGNQQLMADIPAPKTTKAVITLADGKIIALDSLTTLAQENVVINKTVEGKLVYQSTTDKFESTIQYNTLTNPRGSKVVDITLADGSRVWLNAGSSLTYPVTFVGNERKVSISGEAYFEIAHNAVKPFIVSKGVANVLVLGTHFNMNAYEDENDIKVTLIEGRVAVSNNLSKMKIEPGEQAVIAEDGKINVEKNVDVDQVLAWKNGMFKYNSANLETLMRQAARWYDVDVVFASKMISNDTYTGSIPRTVSLATWFRVLEESGVHFKIESRKVIVLPGNR